MISRPTASGKLAAALVLAALSLHPRPAGADPLEIDMDGTVRIGAAGTPLVVSKEGAVSIGAPVPTLTVGKDGTVNIGAPAPAFTVGKDGAVSIGAPAPALTVGKDGTVSIGTSVPTLTVGKDGTVGIGPLTLWSPGTGIGVQASTLYFRSYQNFAWYQGGVHADPELDAGGGKRLMALSSSPAAGKGTLDVGGAISGTELILGNNWQIRSNSMGSLSFLRGNTTIMTLNDGGRLEYNYEGEGLKSLARGYNSYIWYESDARLKSDIAPIPNALAKLRQLRGVTFHWNATAVDRATADSDPPADAAARAARMAALNVGVIAQDVEAVQPESVQTAADGYKSLQYRDLIPLLVQAAKEQDALVADQARQIADQRAEIARLTGAAQAQQADLAVLQAQVARLVAAAAPQIEAQRTGLPVN